MNKQKESNTLKRQSSKRQKIKSVTSFFLAIIPPILVMALVYIVLSYLSRSKVNSLTSFKTIGDWSLFALLLFGVAVPVVYWLLLLTNKISGSYINKVVTIFSFWLLLPSSISMLLSPKTLSLAHVKFMINLTTAFNYGFALLGVIAYGLTVFISREKIRSQSWWVFLITIPYGLVLISLYSFYSEFNDMKSIKGFSAESILSMLKQSNGQLALMNDAQFVFFGISIVIIIILLGVNLYEVIWQKSSKWRNA